MHSRSNVEHFICDKTDAILSMCPMTWSLNSLIKEILLIAKTTETREVIIMPIRNILDGNLLVGIVPR